MEKENKKICVVTGSRADYGLLYWLLKGIQSEKGLTLQLAVTGMHLSPEFGMTVKEIEKDGFLVDARVEMLLASDSRAGITKSVGLGVIGFADALERLRPDLVVVLGDRYEILAAAESAMLAGIPIAHIAGGDITEGAFDDSIRHAVTKMSHLHFVTNADAADRLCRMGENPARVYNVGSPGIDYIRQVELLGRDELEACLNIRFRRKNLLVTYHPVTMLPDCGMDELANLLRALDSLGSDYSMIFTRSNADPCGIALAGLLDDYAAIHENAYVFTSLGSKLYLSLMAEVDAVVGNSSSGLYEAPSMNVPAVNIGSRQQGRLRADSVIDSGADVQDITKNIRLALELDCSGVSNPYGDGYASEKIIKVLREIDDMQMLLEKKFYI